MTRTQLCVVVLLGTALSLATSTAADAGVARTGTEAAASPFDGRWTANITLAQLRRAGASASLAAKLYGPYTALFDKGRFEFRNDRTGAISRGTFGVRGNVSRVVFASGIGVKPGQVSVCTWTLYRDRLTFKAIPGRPSLLCDSGVWTRAG